MDEDTATDGETDRPLRMERCECSICDTAFTDDTVVDMARSIAQHWNEEHGDDLKHSEDAFDEIEYGGHHIKDDIYQVRRRQLYLTVYDILNPDGEKPFQSRYIKKPEAVDVCEDCWRSIKGVDGYRELESSGWRDKFLCDECDRQRTIDQRREENRSLFEYESAGVATDGGRDLPRLNEDNAEYTGCKLGTVSTSVWIHEDDFPLEKGKVIRYAEKENGQATEGRVISDPDERYLFIGVDATTPLLDED